MEKNYKLIITILTVIIVIITSLCILLATGIINFKNNETINEKEPNINQNINNETNNKNEDINKENNNVNQTNNYDELYKDYHVLKFDNKNQNNHCITTNEEYFNRNEKNFVYIVENINIKNKNYTFRHESNIKTHELKVYFNDTVIHEGKTSELVLVNVCNYGNYIMYSMGWEGSPYYEIINVDGKDSLSFRGNKVEYSNGILYVEEIDRKEPLDFYDNELVKYQLDVNSEKLEKLNITREKFDCHPEASGYDC